MRVLLIEDDERIVSFVRRGLQEEGHVIELAADGSEGFRKASDDDYDIILLDLLLPDMHGLQVCRQLRARAIRTPIIMLTALDSLEDKVEGLETGADDYLTKPFEFEELLARIRALLRRENVYREAFPKALIVGDLRLDRITRRAHLADTELKLTTTEFNLLDLLMSAPGRTFSRAEILRQIWGAREDPLTNIVDVYIRHLRQKIDLRGGASLIETVRGYGYRLCCATGRRSSDSWR